MNYNTNIQTRTVTERLPTWHCDGIDWDYAFPMSEFSSMCVRSDAPRRARRNHMIRYMAAAAHGLRIGAHVEASSYGGWPRIYRDVLDVGMCSCWPYWRPRPTLSVSCPLGGAERYDWASLTGVLIDGEPVK